MGSTLDLESSKFLQKIQLHHNSRAPRNGFQSSQPSYTSKTIMSQSTPLDVDLDIEAVMKMKYRFWKHQVLWIHF